MQKLLFMFYNAILPKVHKIYYGNTANVFFFVWLNLHWDVVIGVATTLIMTKKTDCL